MAKDGPAVDLQVRVADAQGLRLQPGGEIRLVITLRAADDPEGEAFGLKVTPWMVVPEGEAPQWRARGAVFSVPADRCYQADFVDSAHLHIALMQRGHTVATERAGPPQASARNLGWSALKQKGLSVALQGASASIPLAWPLGSPASDRGSVVGILRLPVGQRLACPDDVGSVEDPEWVRLVEYSADGNERIKGSLLLELVAAYRAPPSLPSPPSLDAAGNGAGADVHAGASVGAAEGQPSSQADEPASPARAEVSPSEATSDSASESGLASDTASVSGAPSACSTHHTADVEDERSTQVLPPPDLLSPRAVAELLASAMPGGAEPRSSQWLPFGTAARARPLVEGFEVDSGLNIFTINDPASASQSDQPGRLQRLLRRWSRPKPRMKPLKQRLRSTLDPGVRKQRREVRKWRRWHDIFCLLNEIERQLGEAVGLLGQAAASMKRFGESHSALHDAMRLSAFLADAALYFRSEAEVPKRLEARLGDLECIAGDFRGASIELLSAAGHLPADEELAEGQRQLRSECEDLQVDIAVLLESALMAAHQALAEYKKMHCRLELLATEYEPICRLELDSSGPVFLPLCIGSESQVPATSLPEQAVQWALDFSQLVGTASQGLDRLVRDVEQRRRQLKSCSSDFRASMLRYAASGGQPGEGLAPGG